MQLSLRWLQNYIEIPETPGELESLLTGTGLEVDSITDRRNSFDNIVVGEVRTCEKHPNADRLTVCTVNDGMAQHSVVCGASNVATGQKVVFARVGAHLERLGFTIDQRKIRGVESAGMICASDELGLDDDHSGIMVLGHDAVPGTPVSSYLGTDDVILEIGITPNRGDALSHVGTARDIAAVSGRPLQTPEVAFPSVADEETVDIEIQNPALCPRYSAAIVRDVHVQTSPDWLRNALTAVGIRPINNIVDVLNYVMMEIGQPMHAFDLDQLQGGGIVVRTADTGEIITTLDHIERSIPEDALLICDTEGPVAVAGVMGGSASAVTDTTVSILLESAYFQASSVRRTSRLLQLSTDSSYRFERGTDPHSTVWALQRAVQLILDTAGGRFCGYSDVCPEVIPVRELRLRPAFVNRILGIEIDADVQYRILASLGIELVEKSADNVLCRMPTFRSDLEREIDLVEEIARIHGYDNIPVPTRIEMNVGRRFDDKAFTSQLRTLFLGFGFDEILSSSLVSREHAGTGGDNRHAVVDVLNPVSKERPSLRTSLLPSLLEAIDVNIRSGHPSLRIMEAGHVFYRDAENGIDERNMIALAVTGLAQQRAWYADTRESDFFDMKGAVENILSALYIDNDAIFYYDRASTLSDTVLMLEVKGRYAGQLITVPQATLQRFDIVQPVFYAELDVTVLEESLPARRKYRPVPRHPSVTRDLAILVTNDIAARDIVDTVMKSNAAFLRSVHIVDVFRHSDLGDEKKSVAFTMTFQADDRTLKDEDINASVNTIIAMLAKEVNAELRG
ncbi:MAG: phenylalanine--tRNA ligase subunit beta [Bacteroidetes bacterium]|nr:phenylalanine--tRNA ligase subunit beta [Bacteroidota bacterium]